MNPSTILCGLFIACELIAFAGDARADQIDRAMCEPMTRIGQCKIGWEFSRSEGAHYWLQQFDPPQAVWRTIAKMPPGTPSVGSQSVAVEGGYLYRVWACDDADAIVNCSGSTVVWAPFIQSQSETHLIPSRVHLVGSEARFGKPTDGMIMKNADWLTQVIQYNVYQLENALAHAEMSNMPDMTPPSSSAVLPQNLLPADQVQSNIYAVYLARQGRRVSAPTPEQVPRGPHEHPDWH
jgi:hypothetical protein